MARSNRRITSVSMDEACFYITGFPNTFIGNQTEALELGQINDIISIQIIEKPFYKIHGPTSFLWYRCTHTNATHILIRNQDTIIVLRRLLQSKHRICGQEWQDYTCTC